MEEERERADDVDGGLAAQLRGLNPNEIPNVKVQFTDMHDFTLDLTMEEAMILNQVRRERRLRHDDRWRMRGVGMSWKGCVVN